MAHFKKSLDMPTAATNPSKFFKSPQEVLTNSELTRDDKLRILHQWEVDARLLAVAEEENMADGESSQLGAIVNALIALDDESKRPETHHAASPAKHGG
jgi:hypothetical protein